MKDIEEYKNKLRDKNSLVLFRRELIELGITDYMVSKLVESGVLSKIARGEYTVVLQKDNVEAKEEEIKDKANSSQSKIRSNYYRILSVFIKMVQQKRFKLAYKKLVEMQKIIESLEENSFFERTHSLYAFLLQEIQQFSGKSFDLTMFKDLSKQNEHFTNEEDTPHNAHYKLFYEAVCQKDFVTALQHLDICGQIEQEERGSLFISTQTLVQLLKTCIAMHQSFENKGQTYLGKGYALFKTFMSCVDKRKYEEALSVIRKKVSYDDIAGTYNSSNQAYMGLLEKILLLKNSTDVLSTQDREYIGEDIDIFNQSILNGDYLVSYDIVHKIDSKQNKMLQICSTLLDELIELNEKNKEALIKGENQTKFTVVLTDDEIYEMVRDHHFCELEEIIEQEKKYSYLSRLKHNVLRILKYMRNVEKFGIGDTNYNYPFAESDYFHRFFEALRNRDIHEASKNVVECIKLAKEPFEFEIYKMLYDEIYILNESVSDKKALEECMTRRIQVIQYKDYLTIEQMEEVRKITNTILTYYDKLGENSIYEHWLLDILDMIEIAKENAHTSLSFNESVASDKKIEQLQEALQSGDYKTSYSILNTSNFNKDLKGIPYKNLLTYKYLLSILFKIEKSKEVIATPVYIEKSSMEELHPVDTSYLNHLQNLKQYVQNRNYIGALHYYMAHHLNEEYLMELILLCKTNYDTLDESRNKFNTLFTEEATLSKESLTKIAQVYRKDYMDLVDSLSLHNQEKQEQIIEEMAQKIKQL